MFQTSEISSVLFYKGGPTLINLLIDNTELRIIVTGPRMLFERLQLLTTLSAFDGCTVRRLQDLANSLEGTIHCGLVGVIRADIIVEKLRSGGILQIDLGPASMYQSELILRTRTGETFSSLIHRVLSPSQVYPFFVGLYGVPATGHLEHNHGSIDDGHSTHNHSNHTAENHGHS
jgi:hypothetical protein